MTRLSLRLRLAALLSLALMDSAAADQMKISGLTFETPSGFQIGRQGADGVIFQREVMKGSEKGGAIILVGSNRLNTDFDKAYDQMIDGLDQMKDQKPLTEEKGFTTNGYPMRWQVKCCRSGDLPMSITSVGFNPPESLVYARLVMINLEDADQDTITSEFERIVAGFDFAGIGTRPLIPPPAASDTPLSGLYLNVSSGIAINPLGGTDFKVDFNTLYFEPGGLFADEPPVGQGGLTAHCQNAPASCGVYTLSGDSLTRNSVGDRFGTVTTDSDRFEQGEGEISIDGDDYTAIPPVSALTLDGSWSSTFIMVGNSATSSSSISSVRTIVFTPDGRFTTSGFAGATSNSTIGDTSAGVATSSDTAAEKGAYAIEGYTITLTFEDGRVDQLGFYMPDTDDIDLLMIGGSQYLREGRD